jgi:PAS domain-containing protein
MSGRLDDFLIEAIWEYSPCQKCWDDYAQTEEDFFWWQFDEALKVKELSQANLNKIVQSLFNALDDLLEQWNLENWIHGVNPIIQELLEQNPEVFLELCSDGRLSPSNRESLRNVMEQLIALDKGAEWRAENGLDDTDLLGPLHSALNSLTE